MGLCVHIGMQLRCQFDIEASYIRLLLRYPVIAHDHSSASVLGNNLDIVLILGYNYNLLPKQLRTLSAVYIHIHIHIPKIFTGSNSAI